MNALLRDLPGTPLTPEREQELLLTGDREAIVLHALRPAVAYMKRLSRGRLPDDALLSAAYAALAKAMKNFKAGHRGFNSYALPYLRGELASEWRQLDAVRNAAKHEVVVENPKPPEEAKVDFDFDSGHWKELWEQVEPVIRATLSRVEIQVLEGRYRFSLTLAETGDHIGKSRERVRQIEAQALQKLRAALSSRGEL